MKKQIKILAISLMLVSLFFVTDVESAAPTVVTNNATAVTNCSATFNGTLSNLGGVSYAWCRFRYGYETSLGNSTAYCANRSSTGYFSSTLTNLTSGTMYHFRARCNNTDGAGLGVIRAILTPPEEISSITTVANSNSVTLSWTLGTGGDGCYIEWASTKPSPWTKGSCTTHIHSANGTSYTATGLTPGVHYYFKLWTYAIDGPYTSSGNTTMPYNDTTFVVSANTTVGGGGGGGLIKKNINIYVKNRNGQAVPGATVYIDGLELTTDENGYITFDRNSVTEFTVTIEKEGYTKYNKYLNPNTDTTTIVLEQTAPTTTTTTIPTLQAGDDTTPTPGFELIFVISAIVLSSIFLRRRFTVIK